MSTWFNAQNAIHEQWPAEPITRYIDDGEEFSEQPPWDDLYVVVTCKICYEYMLIAHPKEKENSYAFRKTALARFWQGDEREDSGALAT